MGTVVTYDDKAATPFSEVVLDGGDHVRLELDRGGLVIRRVAGSVTGETLFVAGPRDVADLCTALFDVTSTPDPSPLRLLTNIVVEIKSASDVERAFKQASGERRKEPANSMGRVGHLATKAVLAAASLIGALFVLRWGHEVLASWHMEDLKTQSVSVEERLAEAERVARRLIRFFTPPRTAYDIAYSSLSSDNIPFALNAIARTYVVPTADADQDWCVGVGKYLKSAILDDLEALYAVTNAYSLGLGRPQVPERAYTWALRLEIVAQDRQDSARLAFARDRIAALEGGLSADQRARARAKLASWPSSVADESALLATRSNMPLAEAWDRHRMAPCDLQTGAPTLEDGTWLSTADPRLAAGDAPFR